MGIKEKLPLINSSNKGTRIIGYVVYFFVAIWILGAIFPNHTSVNNIESSQTTVSAPDNGPTQNSIKGLLGFWLRPSQKYSIDVQDLGNGTGYYITVNIGAPKDDIWSNEQFLRDTTGTFVDMFQKIFKDKRISYVTLNQNLNNNDAYGNKQEKLAYMVTMSSTAANRISDWKNFKQLAELDYTKLTGVAYRSFVNPGLLQ